jgi:hypothetical protein
MLSSEKEDHMQNNFNGFIIENEISDLIPPEMLVNLGLGNQVMLFRLRQYGDIPFIKLSFARILYISEKNSIQFASSKIMEIYL